MTCKKTENPNKRMINKKLIPTETFNFKEFMKEDGEVDMEKWRLRTWGKKPYTFNWEEEEVFPITCFSCGSIISSDLTVCPICDADLVKEIEEIDTEYSAENTEADNNLDIVNDNNHEEEKNNS